ncbi:hypothetical protein SISNIDRAFT_469109 [Sistotremastrum niveocremeum HHB9708]|uniref:Alpha-type protein kinase domain-containing protein n=1 Tax=Sistotremastrum niveocremeum HHB9708 TaxID=1314777 RepID=A0A164QEA8_9AGAM|nr:hypothetical protein SISNIDRAFT_469109 [Sistotremastrum niveocremeum HHB9708]
MSDESSHCRSCSRPFPFGAFVDGLCALCFEFNSGAIDAEVHKKKLATQCRFCSLTFPLMQGDVCGFCSVKKDNKDAKGKGPASGYGSGPPPPPGPHDGPPHQPTPYDNAHSLYDYQRHQAGAERSNVNQGSSMGAISPEAMALAFGNRGAVPNVSPADIQYPSVPRGLKQYQAQRRTSNILTAKHEAHISGSNPLSTVFIEFSAIAYQQRRTKPPKPFPPVLDGFMPHGRSFPMGDIFLNVLFTLLTRYGGWQAHWEKICAIPWEFHEDIHFLWAHSKMALDLKYFLPFEGNPGWTLGRVYADLCSKDTKGFLVSNQELSRRHIKIHVLVDINSLMKRHMEKITHTSSLIPSLEPTYSAGPSSSRLDNNPEYSHKRERAESSSGPLTHPELASPPRKRSGGYNFMRSPTRDAYAYQAKESGQIPLEKLRSMPSRPLLFQAAFTRAQGHTFVTWETPPAYHAFISHEPFNSTGVQKDVYFMVRENGAMYVAKRIRSFTDAPYWDHYEAVETENYQASLLDILLNEFHAHARLCKAKVYDLQCADTFIAIEIDKIPEVSAPPERSPQPSSSAIPIPETPTSRTDKPEEVSVPPQNKPEESKTATSAPKPPKKLNAYLCEPFISESARLRKFSGSTTAGANKDLMGNTVDALAHFSVIASKGQLLLSDLQGFVDSASFTNDGREVCTLFDVMAHFTYDINRQVVTNRKEAEIKSFLRQHSCNGVCEVLGLDLLVPETLDSARARTTISSLYVAEDAHKTPTEARVNMNQEIPMGYMGWMS